jgi:hypothetical protein
LIEKIAHLLGDFVPSAYLSGRVVQFYYLISSAIEDLRLLADANVSPELRFPWGLHTVEGNRNFHWQLLEISRQAVAVGEALATELTGPNRWKPASLR